MVILCAVVLIAAFISDVRRMIIPNALNAFAVAAGFTAHMLRSGCEGLLFAGTGCAAGFALLLGLYAIGAVGAGDVKLFAGIGAIMGTVFVVQAAVYALLCAGVIGLVLVLIRNMAFEVGVRLLIGLFAFGFQEKKLWLRDVRRQSCSRFPFMYAVLPGALAAWLFSPMSQ